MIVNGELKTVPYMLKIAGSRAKRTKIWPSGVSGVVVFAVETR